MIREDHHVGGKWLGKEVLEESVYASAKVYGVAENEGLCDIGGRCDGGRNEPGDVEECGAGDGVVEELREVANVGVVNGEMTVDVTARIEAK